ncbi:MAG: hypothetical protein ACPG8W_04385 [Candidatus Promineifilaceae bacterium]
MRLTRLQLQIFTSASVLLTLLLVVGLWIDWPFGIRGTTWTWARREMPVVAWRVVLLATLIAAWLSLTIWVSQQTGVWQRWKTTGLLGAVVLFTPLLLLTVEAQHLERPLAGAFMETTMPTSGFFHEGVQIGSVSAFVQAHTAQMGSYRGVHLQTQPPGWPVAFWAATQFFDRFPQLAESIGHRLYRYDCASPEINSYRVAQVASAALHVVILYLTGLGGVLLYLLGRALFSAETARLSAMLFPFWPGLLVFKSIVDILYAVVALAALLLMWHALRQRSRPALITLAALLVAMTWVSFGVGATIVWVGLFALVQVGLWERNAAGLRRTVQVGVCLVAALVAFWLAIYFVWDVSWWEMFQRSTALHHAQRASSPWWGVYNFYELALFGGVPLFLVALLGVAAGFGRIRQTPARGDGWAIAWAIFTLLLNLSGQVQAETGRIWLFLMPGMLLTAVGTMTQWTSATGQSARRWLLIALAVQAFSVSFLLGRHAVEPRTPAVMRRVGAATSALEANYNSWLHLLDIGDGYSLGEQIGLEQAYVSDTSDGLAVHLMWRAQDRISAELNTFVHLLDQDGNLIAQSDSAPANGQLPTWCWIKGELITDSHQLSPIENASAIRIGLYDWQTGQRLSVAPPVLDHAILIPLP